MELFSTLSAGDPLGWLGVCQLNDPLAELRVHQLARTAVPGIERLSLSDTVSIRRTSDAFASWRAQLSLGLDHAHRLREEHGPEVDVAAAVSEVLAGAREQLFAETRRCQVLSRAGLMSFTADALGDWSPELPAESWEASWGRLEVSLPLWGRAWPTATAERRTSCGAITSSLSEARRADARHASSVSQERASV